MGRELMLRSGFPAAMLKLYSIPEFRKLTLIKCGLELKWPKDDRIPSVGWIAGQTDYLPIYKHLYSATSRYLHFSASEAFRRAYAFPDSLDRDVVSDSVISLDSEPFTNYKTDFALYWLPYLLLHTLKQVHLIESNVVDVAGGKTSPQHLFEVVEHWSRTVPCPPIVTPHDVTMAMGDRFVPSWSETSAKGE